MKKGYSGKLLLAAIALSGSGVALAANGYDSYGATYSGSSSSSSNWRDNIGPYVGLNYTRFEFESEETEREVEPDGVTLRLGMEFNQFLGLEVRGATGVSADKRRTSLGTAEFDLDRLYGGYLKVSVPVGEMVRPYVIAGYTEAKGEVRFTNSLGTIERETDTVNDESYGAGIDFNLTDTFGMNLEYMRYLDKDDYELNAISVGFRSAF
ncbi:outer membrane beta-barrel protein [Alcanivorax quisquiliarum]|uniref:Porin family protein n=1 Tax=Alcanivorax quisquiliarum TaxID=2933565 RepID=A0ABT0E9K6_9GAMM|nr:outer membrane beta-barrel protein [Alcanivorax quisquiliarum]MCK0538522.1 porin family protein [Alcanivorax quisquiliarum]